MRWKENKPVQDWPTRRLYPTRDKALGEYFIKDKIPARGAFAPYYRKYLEMEDELLKEGAASYIHMKIREGKIPPD